MKIQISPPQTTVRVPSHAPTEPLQAAADMETLRQNHDQLDLTRQRKFRTRGNSKSESEVDEAAIVLIELSVLVYGNLNAIGKTAAKLRHAYLGLFGKKGNREADLQWLEREPELAEFVRNLSQSIQRTSSAPASWTPQQPSSEDLGSPEEILSRAVRRFNRAEKLLQDSPAESQPVPAIEAIIAERPTDATAQHQAEKDRRNRAPHALAIMRGDAGLICFRGTSGTADWLLDFAAWPALLGPLRHWGFEKRWRSLRPQIEKWLETQTTRIGDRPILYIGGHSLGGAIATLAAADLSPRYPIARVVTIGSPRPGVLFFRRGYRRSPAAAGASGKPRSLKKITTRFVHGMDGIAFVPPWPIFQHLSRASWLDAKDRVLTNEYFSVEAVAPLSDGYFGRAGFATPVDTAIPSWNWRYAVMQCARYASTSSPQRLGTPNLCAIRPDPRRGSGS